MTHLTAKEIVDLNKEYTFYSWSNQGQVNPIPMVKAEGVYFWDTEGKRYIDWSSQLVNVNIGHQHPDIVAAIIEQVIKAGEYDRQSLPDWSTISKRLGVVATQPTPSRPLPASDTANAWAFVIPRLSFHIWTIDSETSCASG